MRTNNSAQHLAAARRSGFEGGASWAASSIPICSRADSSRCRVAPAGPALSMTDLRNLALGARTPQYRCL